MEIDNLSTNWKKLQTTLKVQKAAKSVRQSATRQHNGLKRKISGTADTARDHDLNRVKRPRHLQHRPKMFAPDESANQQSSHGTRFVIDYEGGNANNSTSKDRPSRQGDRINEGLAAHVAIGKFVAIDCEMVGISNNPDLESALARVSIVNYDGEQVYDSYVQPREPVTDWRTHVSGITPQHMAIARSFEEVQKDIDTILRDRIVVGHSVSRDFEVLMLSHPRRDIRDTAKHPPYRDLAGGGSPKLKFLVSSLLGIDIQGGQHSSIEDARATMLLFRRDKEAFEREHLKKFPIPKPPTFKTGIKADDAVPEQAKKKKKKKKRKKH